MAVIARASLVEYFKDQVEGALAQQRVPANDGTAHYVVQLLADTMRGTTAHSRAAALLDSRPLALRLAAAMDDRCPAPGRALARRGRRRPAARRLFRAPGCVLGGVPRGVLPPGRRVRLWHARAGIAGAGADLQGSRPSASRSMPTRSARSASAPRCRRRPGWCARSRAWQRSRDRVTERLLVERGVVLDAAGTCDCSNRGHCDAASGPPAWMTWRSIVQWRTICPPRRLTRCTAETRGGRRSPVREGKSLRMSTLRFGEAWRVSQ